MENTVNLNTASSEEIRTGQTVRFGAVDILRGILIFAVVLSHAWFAEADILGNWFPYCLHAFFFLSGYTYKPGRGYAKNLWKRIVTILVPYIVFSILCNLCYPIYVDLVNSPFVQDSSAIWKGFFTANAMNMLMSTPMWFLAALMTTSLVFLAIADKVRDSLPKTLITVGILIVIALAVNILKVQLCPLRARNAVTLFVSDEAFPWYIDLVPFSTAMMLLGSYAGGKKWFTKINLKLFILAVVLTAVCFIMNHWFPGSGKTSVVRYVNDNHWYGVLTAFVIAVSGTVGTLIICNIFDKIPVLRDIIKWMGRNSIWILCIHYCVIMLVELKIYNMGYLTCSIMDIITKEMFGYGFVIDKPKDIVIKVAVAIFSILVSGVYAVLHNLVKKQIKKLTAKKKEA
ncbi:MAG: acyltransferase family protein [Oscillospiraceae bacterium]|nr:acyltransferase family protein [Oscillospiraceae bacterium]